MRLLLLSSALPLTAIAHPGHQHLDWTASLTHSPSILVFALLGGALLGFVSVRLTSLGANKRLVRFRKFVIRSEANTLGLRSSGVNWAPTS